MRMSPPPAADLHSTLNEVIVKGSLANIISEHTEFNRAVIMIFCSFLLLLYYEKNLNYDTQMKV